MGEIDSPNPASHHQAELDEICATRLLDGRENRAPDFANENRVMVELIDAMVKSPQSLLQRLVQAATELTGAPSAGISVLEQEDQKSQFRWRATAGKFAPLIGSTLPRDFSPCGVVLDRNATQLMVDPERHYPYIADIKPKVEEVLLVPFYQGDIPVGTLWVVSHTKEKQFVREDARILVSLSRFASAAFVSISNLQTAEDANRRLVQEIGERKLAVSRENRVAAHAADISAKFEAFFDQCPFYAAILNVEGRVTDISRVALDACGYRRDEAIGQLFWETGWWHGSAEIQLRIRQAVEHAAAGATFKEVLPYWLSDGSERVTDFALTPVWNDAKEVVFLIPTGMDITERKQIEEQRRDLLESERLARSAAEESSRIKDEFLATLSHELRTPLSAIVGWSQILRGSKPGSEDLAQGLETIERNARAQTQIIDDLLDMSRIISGKVRLEVHNINLADVINAAIATVQHAANAKGVKVNVSLDPLLSSVAGDANRLQQVFWNLLSNAIKFTPKGGQVQVTVERVHSEIEVSVRDTGDGIKPEFLPHVFDRFRQADASTTRRHGGLGLGLAIVRQLVELHGGVIHVASDGLGRGATFTVSLPVSALQIEPVPESLSAQPPRPLNYALTEPCMKIAGVRVLAVDDEPDARAMIKRFLEDCDAIVTVVATADEAIAYVESGRPDILISDVGMPHHDGYSLIATIRALGKNRGGDVPAVALTAYARSVDRTRALLSGFQAHLTKPIEPNELIGTIARLTGRLN